MGINGTTRLVGVMGWPVGHSLSPTMHNAAFAALGLNWAYVPLPVPPERVGDALRGLAALGFAGVNVTVPHKQAVMPHLAERTDAAQAIGAVNTVIVRADGTLLGDNTDAAGFLADLQQAGVDVAARRPVILGAGGSARAVAYALAAAGVATVHILARNPTKAEPLARDMAAATRAAFHVGHLPGDLPRLAGDVDLVINTTPLGMTPHADASPWPDGLPLRRGMAVYDLVYNPADTRLLQQARRGGAQAIGGIGMLVQQGAAAFRLWTGQAPPVDVMQTACEHAMKGR